MENTVNDDVQMFSEADALRMIEIHNREIEKAETLKRLQENKDFKALVIDSYFREEAIRLTSLLAVSPQGDRPKIIDDLYAISAFSAYLSSIDINADRAVQNKAAIQEALHELKEGEFNE